MVLDYHHYMCNKGDIDIKDYYTNIFNTWKDINPKIHFSSPKNKTKKDIRSHHDYINPDDFISFINEIKHLPFDIDIMLEAKAKDEALFRLVRGLKYKTNYKFIDDTTFIVN
jgi:UV DNA damage endonuclease